jgi:hypothetical protein
MWNMKCMIISVITGATRTVPKLLKKNAIAIAGKHRIDSLQEGKACDKRHDDDDENDDYTHTYTSEGINV